MWSIDSVYLELFIVPLSPDFDSVYAGKVAVKG